MAKVVVELNSEGVRELLRSSEMMSICQKHAQNAVNRLGSGYSVNTMVGRNRVNAEVTADTREARIDNFENNSILKAIKG